MDPDDIAQWRGEENDPVWRKFLDWTLVNGIIRSRGMWRGFKMGYRLGREDGERNASSPTECMGS